MGELIEITSPDEEQEGTEARLARWLKAPGDAVEEHEPIAELETDKVALEIAAPAAGSLVEILKQEGEEVAPGEVLGRMEAASGKPTASKSVARETGPTPANAEALGPMRQLSPAVRRLLKEHDLDPSVIAGTGRGGRITHEDVKAHLAAAERGAAVSAIPGQAGPSRRLPLSPMRRRIAEHMVESVSVAPHVTSVFEADLGAILDHRRRHREAFEKDGVKLTLGAYFVAASVKAIRAVPEINSRLHEDELEIFEDCNIGVATALGKEGLVVPVVHRAQELDLLGIASRLQELSKKAAARSFEREDMRGGTFSISNHGVSDSLLAAPIIINQPQSAILGIGRLQKRAVVRESEAGDAIAIRPMAYVTLTIDHRVIDGFGTNAFLSEFVTALESWT